MLQGKSSIGYSGELRVKVGKTTLTAHNSGTFNLFALFMKLLVSTDLIKPTDIPYYIDIRNNNNSSILNNRLLINKQVRADRTYGYVCIITASIRANDLNTVKLEDNVYKICLLSQEGNNILAQLDISKALLDQLLIGRQALLEWTLRIQNMEVNA